MLRHAVGQDLHGPGEQALTGNARRVRLQQGQPGQVLSGPAREIAEAGADVLDAEVGHPAAVIPYRLYHEHRVGHAVQQRVDGCPGMSGGQAAVREPGGDHGRAACGQRGQLLADLGAERRERLEPADLHHAEQLAAALAQREDRPSAVGRAGYRRGVAFGPPRGPPQVGGAPGDPLGRAVELRREVPPPAGLALAQPGLAEQRERAVRVKQPQHDGARTERPERRPGHGAGQLRAIGGQLGGGLDHQRTGPGRARPGRVKTVGADGNGERRTIAAGRGFREQDRGGHLGDRDPGRRGQLGELAGGLGRGQAEALHQRAAGHRDDRLPRGRGPDLVQDPPLVLDDRGQPQHVVVATGHDHPPPRTAYR